ncbi:Phosphatidylinositol-specific phospholipase C [Pleurostoma richardsiae]|uniref:Phosphatidylinositol-specific phospholipase C n=1 Tax=Pleurostoma richardsiae TaxID=41990 RepID=A0AA38RBS1_9PEZI|nr:Phosphatidylinositol-specific phospholipase C [Pleurostoma richardsiae]
MALAAAAAAVFRLRPGRFYILLLFVTASFSLIGLTLLSHLSWNQVPQGYFAKQHRARYSYDLDRAHHPDWMAQLPDSAPLTALSIPGSHDTLTYGIAEPHYRCQNHELAAQLRAGLRYLDVRAVLLGNDSSLRIYHGEAYTGHTYAEVLQIVFAFLDEQPGEAVVMRVKEEKPPIGEPQVSFGEAFNRYQFSDPETAPGWAEHFYQWPPPAEAEESGTAAEVSPRLPTLGELRGKILLLQNFVSEGGPYGLLWESPQMTLEDYWLMGNVTDLEDKWTDIRDNLAGANTSASTQDGTGSDQPPPLFLTHLSATGAVLPSQAAAGIPANRTFVGIEGMNDRTGSWLSAHDGATGVVIADFPGAGLVDEILRHNEWLLQ